MKTMGWRSWLALGFGFLLTVLAVIGSLIWNYVEQQQHFDLQTANKEELLLARIQQATAASVALATLFNANQYVDADQFRLLANGLLQRWHFLQTAFYLPRIRSSNQADFETSVQAQGLPNFRIQGETLLDADYPVRYFEPFSPLTARWLGRNLAHYPYFATAIQNSLTTDKLTLATGSGAFGTKQEFWLLQPLSNQQSINGFVGLALNIQQLTEGIQLTDGHLRICLENGSITQQLFHGSKAAVQGEFQLVRRYRLPFADQQLAVEFQRSLTIWQLVRGHCVTALSLGLGATLLFFVLARQFTARREAELALRCSYQELEHRVQERTAELEQKTWQLLAEISEREEAETRLAEAQHLAHVGSWELDLATNHLSWSKEIFYIFEIDPDQFEASYEAFLKAIHPDDREMVHQLYQDALKNKTFYTSVHRLLMQDGRIKYVNERGRTFYHHEQPVRSVGTVQDITEQRLAEIALEETSAKLKSSNRELQSFAYIVSHDLQEPLRMISSYLQLLSRRYQDQLDQDAQEFIRFAVDGSQRMSAMIEGLLEYSRVETQGQAFAVSDLEKILTEVLANLQLAITERNAKVTFGSLPKIASDESQIARLLQNLISNALKFCDKEVPQIHIEAIWHQDKWLFSVADNGIGIPAEQAERIFTMFQRLHTRDEYPGMGIGLAVCKRIVERHGGKIWLTSTLNKGTTFYFTLEKTDNSE